MYINKDSVLYRVAKRAYRTIKDIESSLHIKTLNKKYENRNKIRVGFLVQEPSIWDKLEPILDAMLKDERFETLLFIVPPVECYNIGDSMMQAYNYEGNYFINKYNDSIKVLDNNRFIDITQYNLDYLFYQRPYDELLPVEYRSESIYRKIKICYMAYYNSINTLYKNIDNFKFLKNSHIVFYACDDEVQYERRNLRIGCLIGAHKILNVGYPMLDRYLTIKESESETTILWTPRWTPELKSGGSNFLRYKNEFVELKSKFGQACFIERPHPLTFNNYISNGLLSEEEAQEYKALLRIKGIELDESEDMFPAFQRASILISDYSSVLLPFFLTGKPIIYCTVIGATGLEFTSEFKEIINTLYIAESWDDVKRFIKMIIGGNDYLKDSRLRIIKDKYNHKRNSIKNILDVIYEDYYEG